MHEGTNPRFNSAGLPLIATVARLLGRKRTIWIEATTP